MLSMLARKYSLNPLRDAFVECLRLPYTYSINPATAHPFLRSTRDIAGAFRTRMEDEIKYKKIR